MKVVGLLLAGLLAACGGGAPEPEADAEFSRLFSREGVRIDTVGVRDIAEGDSLVEHAGLLIVETTVRFPSEAAGGEVFAWEFMASELRPIKLIIVRDHPGGDFFELVGESETVVPRQKGLNRFVLREPIPVDFKYMFGLVQPEEGVVPIKKVYNWKSLIAARPLERPLMRREHFATYGWRYAVRVFWRVKENS